MTFVFVNHWARRIGGAEKSLLDILRYFAETGNHRLHLITSEKGALTQQAHELGIECHVIPCSRSIEGLRRDGLVLTHPVRLFALFSYFRYCIAAGRTMQRLHPDIIHANVPKAHILVMCTARVLKKPTYFIHMRELFEPGQRVRRLYELLFPRRERCHLIAISTHVKKNLAPPLQNHARVIYNGVHLPEPTTPQRRNDNTVRFIYLGRVVPWKGCHLLIDAFADAYSRCAEATGITLSIVGDTAYWPQQYRQMLQQQIERHGLGNCCILQPFTSEVTATLRSHDVFCIASRNEPFGRVVAEAGACALPSIAFDSGGVTEIIEHAQTGILVPYGDTQRFADALCRYAAHPEYIRKDGARAYQRIRNYFNARIQLEKLYRDITSSLN